MASRYEYILSNSLSRPSDPEATAVADDSHNLDPEMSAVGSTTQPHAKDLEAMRRVVLTVLLFPRALLEPKNRLDLTLIYTTACVGMTCLSYDNDVSDLCKNAFQWLQETLHVSLQPELDYCASTIQGQSSTASGVDLLHVKRTRLELESRNGQHPFEVCDICEEIIDWTTWTESQCANGHNFVRCSMSFLSIQGPRMSQRCGLCGKVFLSDAILWKDANELPHDDSEEEMVQDGDSEEPDGNPDVTAATSSERNHSQDHTSGLPTEEVSLATLLFRACDVCIYCGGKLMG
ncbi:MAG: hypothetical protein M1816_001891 [Peltula sp. TS41687]|nr:MAG: hypothetical protein M1816_001891 [Peltula sp. TS41687]